MATDVSGLLSTGEAARYAGVSRQRIDQLVRAGVLEAQRVAGRWVVEREAVDAWLATRRTAPGRREVWNLAGLRRRRDDILALAARRRLGNVRVFGSAARGDATERSDVDLLVDRLDGATALDVAEFATDVEEALGCRVDVVVDGGAGAALAALRASAVGL